MLGELVVLEMTVWKANTLPALVSFGNCVINIKDEDFKKKLAFNLGEDSQTKKKMKQKILT